MKRNLRAYVRVDASNRVIPGSMVMREAPGPLTSRKNGTWIEVQTYVCCIPPGTPGGPGAPITEAVPAIVAPDTLFVEFTINGITEGPIDTGTITGATLVTYLTTNYSGAGTFTLDGTNIIFTPTTPGTTFNITADTNVQTVVLPALVGVDEYHIELENGGLTTGDIDTGTTTPATLITFLTTNHATEGTYTLNVGDTAVYFTPANVGTTLTITAGA